MKIPNAFKASLRGWIPIAVLTLVAIGVGRWIVDPGGDLPRRHVSWERDVLQKLVMERHLPSGGASETADGATAIYVLGGNQANLTLRFRKAASLYHQGSSGKILILSRPGTTEFSPDVGRNLTNDEWGIRQLEILEVKSDDIEPVHVRSGHFGTFSEANAVSRMLRRRGCKRLVLVTSDYHTRRAFISFSKYLSGTSTELYVYGAGEVVGTRGLLSEYLKLLAYQYVLLPLDR